MEVHPSWAPLAARRFGDLVGANYFKNMRFYWAKGGLYAKFGLAGLVCVCVCVCVCGNIHTYMHAYIQGRERVSESLRKTPQQRERERETLED